jgi:hypothetical protein
VTREYGSPTAFFDLIFNILCCFVVLFSISFLLMSRKIEEDKKIRSNAEFMISSTWPKLSDDDIDLYVEDPFGNIVFFRRREEGLMHLDRDDIGRRSDTVRGADGSVYQIEENREIVTIRGIIPGEYVVNVHMYLDRVKDSPTPVTVKVEKLNPLVTLVTSSTVLIGNTGDEKTAFRFTIDAGGEVTGTSSLAKPLAGATPYGADEHIYDQEEEFGF